MRKLLLENYKNLGICNDGKGTGLLLNDSLDSLGGLVVILGENNVGKSNVLNALESFGDEFNGGR